MGCIRTVTAEVWGSTDVVIHTKVEEDYWEAQEDRSTQHTKNYISHKAESLCSSVVQTKKERKTNSANQAAPCGILCYAAAEWVERLLNKTSVVEWRVAS